MMVLFTAGCARASGRHGDSGGMGPNNPGDPSNGGGGGGGGDDGNNGDPMPVDPNSGNCSNGSTKLMYLLDDMTKSLYSYKPDQKDISQSTLTPLGTLSCPSKSSPNSMSVDRRGIAWVEYGDDNDASHDQVFEVDLTTLRCTATSYQTGSFGTRYGMAFVASAPGANVDTLYVATGNQPYRLGIFNTSTLMISKIADMNLPCDGCGPELSGTGDAHLWGFFPDPVTPRVSEIDKLSGAEGHSYPITAAAGEEDGYAFAFWGGDYWVFLKKVSEKYSTLYHVHGDTGAVDTLALTGHHIVGAGSSTCAPTNPGIP